MHDTNRTIYVLGFWNEFLSFVYNVFLRPAIIDTFLNTLNVIFNTYMTVYVWGYEVEILSVVYNSFLKPMID